MNIGSRIAAWFSGKKLPYDAEVEYIESPQDLTSDIIFSTVALQSGKISFDLTYTNDFRSYTNWGVVIGCTYVSSDNPKNRLLIYAEYRYGYGREYYGIGVGSQTFNSKRIVRDKRSFELREGNLPIDIVFNRFGMRLYSMSLYDSSDALVFDAIPVRSNGKAGLYDKVSGNLWVNDSLLFGPDKPANGGGYKCLVRFVKSLVASLSSLSRYLRKEVAR